MKKLIVSAVAFFILAVAPPVMAVTVNAIIRDGTTGAEEGTSANPLQVQFSGSQVIASDVSIGESLTVDLTLYAEIILADDGTLRLGGNGDESLDFDFKSTANNVTVSSTTGVTTTIWDGDFVIQEEGDGRTVAISDTDPHIRAMSADRSVDGDYIEMYHDQTDGQIVVGAGALIIDTAGGRIFYRQNGNSTFTFFQDTVTDQNNFGVYDAGGNQLLITNNGNVAKDHDHPLTTNPTLFIHSDKDPDTANDEWVSFEHNVTDSVFRLGSGDFKMEGDLTASIVLTTSTASTGTSLIIEDNDGDGCTEIAAINGVLVLASITCP